MNIRKLIYYLLHKKLDNTIHLGITLQQAI